MYLGNSTLVSRISSSGNYLVDPLLGEYRWGSGTETTKLTYSFPWTTQVDAYFPDDYSDIMEFLAETSYGFSETAMEAVRRGLDLWESVANIEFIEVDESQGQIGDIRFAYSSAVGTFWGWAYLPYNNGADANGDVWVNPEIDYDNWAPGLYNFHAIIHEIGHALGLEHPFEGPSVLPQEYETKLYTVMSYTDPPGNLHLAGDFIDGEHKSSICFVLPETPMLLDIAAIQYMYGENVRHNAGDEIYLIDPARPFFKTIWDGGGADTLSLVDFDLSCFIDLTPGAISDLGFAVAPEAANELDAYDGSGALSIAFGSVIENVIGGSGGDVLFGNLVANQIWGGEGDDTLYGDSGDDILFGDGGDDFLRGGDGDDTIDGGAGNDIMSGGTGINVFRFREDFGNDVIDDFRPDRDSLVFVSQDGNEIAYTAGDFEISSESSGGALVSVDLIDQGLQGSIFLNGVAGDEVRALVDTHQVQEEIPAPDPTMDVIIVQRGIIGKGAGHDTYIISNWLLDHGARVTISDVGQNSIQIVDGLSISRSMCAKNAVLLETTNGATITILGADSFSYRIGGNPLKGDWGMILTHEEFVVNVLGADVPKASEITHGDAVLINSSVVAAAGEALPALRQVEVTKIGLLQPKYGAVSAIGESEVLGAAASVLDAGQGLEPSAPSLQHSPDDYGLMIM